MISVRRLLLLFTLVSVFSLNLLQIPLFAQEEREGIGISPTTLTLDADPGEKLNGQFTVLNSGNTPIRYRVYANDFGISNEEYEKDFESIPKQTSPTSWFTLPEGIRELAPGAQEKLEYSITVPKDTVPRGYYAVIFAETAIPEIDSTGVARLKRVGSLAYLTVNGGSIKKGEFLDFKTEFWYRQKTLKPSVRVQNSGNVHFDATGEVRLKNIFGHTVSKAAINGTLLPQTIRKFTSELKTSQPVGLYRVEGEVTFLDTTVSLGPNWVIVASPLWFGLLLLVIVAWIAWLIFWIRRREQRKKK